MHLPTNTKSRSIRHLFAVVLVALVLAVGAARGQDAKNVILMISDGAGFNAFAAASYYEYGALGKQPYDKFPAKLACTTYMIGADGRPQGYDPVARWASFTWVTDGGKKSKYTGSAAAATAMYTGVKTYKGAISVDVKGRSLTTIGQIAKSMGKSVGVVTSMQFSHATPAALAAHNVSHKNYEAIAEEMIYGGTLDVIMGCGHPDYGPLGNYLKGGSKNTYKHVGGKDAWDDLKGGTAGTTGAETTPRWSLIESKEAFESLARGALVPKRLIGVARTFNTLQYGAGNRSGKPYDPPFNPYVPTLQTMTTGAINVLGKNTKGFFLMVEGGAVDWANHDNNLGRMIEEQIEFNKAVEAVVDWVADKSNWDETLLIVTSDHECGNLWGPESGPSGAFTYLMWDPVTNNGAAQIPGHKYHSDDHSNALVPLFAIGPGSAMFGELIDGVDPVRGRYVDNTDIFTVMRRAMGAPSAKSTPGVWVPRRRPRLGSGAGPVRIGK